MSKLSYNGARDVILGVLMPVWNGFETPPLHIEFDDAPTNQQPSGVPWGRATIRNTAGAQSSLTGPFGNSKRFTNGGTLFVQLFAPIGDGSETLYDMAQAIVDAYRVAKHCNVWFRNVQMNEVGARGPWEQINVLADFTYDNVT